MWLYTRKFDDRCHVYEYMQIKQIMKKSHIYRMRIDRLEHPLNSIKRNKLLKLLKELGVHLKLRRLIHMSMKRTIVSVKIQKDKTKYFQINKGVKQDNSR